MQVMAHRVVQTRVTVARRDALPLLAPAAAHQNDYSSRKNEAPTAIVRGLDQPIRQPRGLHADAEDNIRERIVALERTHAQKFHISWRGASLRYDCHSASGSELHTLGKQMFS